MSKIAVLVSGGLGRMGSEVVRAVCNDRDLALVGIADVRAEGDSLAAPQGSEPLPQFLDVRLALETTRPQVMVDFTSPGAVLANALLALEAGTAVVIGTTGLAPADVAGLDARARERGLGVVVAPNFALGAVLMIECAKLAARFYNQAEIIELHHEKKVDAPSGTALQTADAMVTARGKDFETVATERETLSGVRGGTRGGIPIHSIRLPGLVAHQEVMFGGLGETFIVQHNSTSRESFMPGVVLAIKEVVKLDRLVYGLDRLLGLAQT